MRAVAYIRVSRVAGRGGDSFISPELQEEAIRSMADRLKLEIVETITELDASGGDPTRKGWLRAISMVEGGQVGAILVYNLSRFSRSQLDALTAIDRIRAAGGELHSAQEGTFDSTAAGTLQRDLLLRVAQYERDRARENFAASTASAIARGIPVISRIPVGYLRDPQTRKLVVDPAMAPVVKQLFEKRAAGGSWLSLSKWFIANGGSTKTGPAAIKWIIGNRTYLGHIRSGANVKRHAHEAIVSQYLFDKANAVKGRRPRHDGSLSSQVLLAGLVRCESCNHVMGLVKMRRGAGYACWQPACSARAGATAADLDAEVVARLFAYVNRVAPAVHVVPGTQAQRDREVARAKKALDAAEYDRQVFIRNRDLRRLLSEDEYNEELAALAEALTEARLTFELLARRESEPPNTERLEEIWATWTDESRREFLARTLRDVIVRSANKRRIPVSNRLAVRLEGAVAARRWLLRDGAYASEPFAG